MIDKRRLRACLNWSNGSTPLGLAIARLGGASVRRGPDGLWLAEHYRLPFPVAGAFTVGNVITTAQTFADRERAIPGTLAHERRHTWQYVYCLGLPYFPAYGLAMAWSWLTTGDRAANCYFEQRAGLALGGYQELPRRSLGAGLAALGRVLRGVAMTSAAWPSGCAGGSRVAGADA